MATCLHIDQCKTFCGLFACARPVILSLTKGGFSEWFQLKILLNFVTIEWCTVLLFATWYSTAIKCTQISSSEYVSRWSNNWYWCRYILENRNGWFLVLTNCNDYWFMFCSLWCSTLDVKHLKIYFKVLSPESCNLTLNHAKMYPLFYSISDNSYPYWSNVSMY